MAAVITDFVLETAYAAPSTGTVSLGGAVSGLKTWVAGLGTGVVVRYMMFTATKNKWEKGYGTLTTGSPSTLTRTLIDSSTGSLIDWQPGDLPIYIAPLVSADEIANMRCNFRGSTAPTAPLQLGMVWADTTAGVTGVVWKVCTNTAAAGTWSNLWRVNETSGLVTLLINEVKGANVASAATADIWTPADGQTVHVTGTATITSFGTAPQAGARRNIVADAAFSMTHGASLNLPFGGASVTVAVGDMFTVYADTTTTMYVTNYVKADGTPLRLGNTGIRQTVQAGPVDTSGLPTFLPSTSGSLNLTTQNITSSVPFIVASANSAGANGPGDRIGISIANLTWTGLTASRAAATPNYLYVTVSAAGVLTTGFTTVAPVYQWGGTPATTSGLITFNISEMKAYLGNGSSAPQTNVVLVGEAATDGSTVISTVAYAYNGHYDSGFTATLPTGGGYQSRNANIGLVPRIVDVIAECTTTDSGYAVGDTITGGFMIFDGASTRPLMVSATRNVVGFAQSTAWGSYSKTAGTGGSLTAANWKYKVVADRGW